MNAETEQWLIRTPAGWTEPRPPRCACGSTRHLLGWVSCPCGGGPFTGGHRTWRCRDCEHLTLIGCVTKKRKRLMQ